jgi:type I restriction enzyme, S subunit
MKKKLGEICNIDWGNTSLTKKSYMKNGKFLAVSAKGCDGRINHYEHGEDVCVLSAIGAQCGKMFFPQEKFTAIKNTITLKPKKELVGGKFLYYLFTSIELPQRGAAQPFISKGDIEKFEIDNLPNIDEQQHILAKLDTVFTEIDKIKKTEEAKLKKNQTLIQNFLNKIFNSNQNLNKLGNCTLINPPKSEVNNLDSATEVSFIPMKDMGINNISAIPNQKQNLQDVKGSYTYFAENDILLAKITPCFENGKLGIASKLLNRVGFGSSEYIVFRPNKNLKKEWLYYFLNRDLFRIEGAQNMSGAVGHKRVDKDFIANTLIPIPSLEEQEKIIFILKNLSTHSKTISEIILKKVNQLNLLKKSILSKLLNNNLLDVG